MERPRIINGYLHTGFCIYIRKDPELSDDQILFHFGRTGYQRVDSLASGCRYSVITDVGEWVLLADDLFYGLWNTPTTLQAIESLSKTHDIFSWFIEDCDPSFEYKIFENGKLIRHYAVDYPHFTDQIVRTDFGRRLPYESELLLSDLNSVEKMRRMCTLVGIQSTVTRESLRLYMSSSG